MDDLFSFGLLAFTSFFSLITPIGTMPIFMSMTADFSDKDRSKTARKAILVSFIILIVFAVSGQIIFQFFGISVNSLKIAGGIIFFLMGQDMLQARLGKIKVSEDEITSVIKDISITPLAIPMICGPGAITNAIVLMQEAPTLMHKIILLGTLSVVLLIALLILLSANKIIKVIGETGNKVLMRLMGLIVMVIAVEFFFSGLKPIIIDILNSR